MKMILFSLVLLFSIGLFPFGQEARGAIQSWDSQLKDKIYKSKTQIVLHLDGKKYLIPNKTKYQLIEISMLKMVKIHLHKYRLLTNCPSKLKSIETDLEVITVDQPENKESSVGVNLTKGCILEVFISLKEYRTNSFLK